MDLFFSCRHTGEVTLRLSPMPAKMPEMAKPWQYVTKPWHNLAFRGKSVHSVFSHDAPVVRDKGQEENAHTHRQTQAEIHMYAHLGTRTNTFKYVSQAILPRREEKIAGNASPRATEFDYRIGRKSRGPSRRNVLGHPAIFSGEIPYSGKFPVAIVAI